jgi:type VI secretion system protein ImpF
MAPAQNVRCLLLIHFKMKKQPKHDRFVPPIMQAFRAAFRERDSERRLDVRSQEGERVLAGRRTTPRNVVSEAVLRQDLAEDVAVLLNTVNLASAVDLKDLEEVQSSILNFGVDDLTSISADSASVGNFPAKIRKILETYEARLAQGTVTVIPNKEFDQLNTKLSLHVSADMYATPSDVPIEFVADVEPFGNNVKLTKF